MFWPKPLTYLFLKFDVLSGSKCQYLKQNCLFRLPDLAAAAAAIKHSPQRTGEIIIMVRILSPPPDPRMPDSDARCPMP